MIFNNVIFTLRELCFEKEQKYRGEYEFIGGKHFCGYLAFDEIAFKLSMLVDKEFRSFDEFKETVRKSIGIHYDYYLAKQLDAESEALVNSAKEEFLKCLEAVSINATPKNYIYYRVVTGSEAEGIIKRFGAIWHYDTSYWFPLEPIPDDISEFLFLPCDVVEKYWDLVFELMSQNGERLYCYGESCYCLDYCEEIEEMHFYAGTECAYTDKAFSSFIYFSHERTVSFAGSIVPKIKKLLQEESAYFNKWFI